MLSDDRHIAGSRPFLASGTCKREDAEAHGRLISLVIDACVAETKSIGVSMYCIASDGESRRGASLTALTQSQLLDERSPLYAILGGMRLMNLLVGNNNLTTDKDPKHIMKRCRNLLLRKSGVLILDTHITPALLRFHLKESGLSSVRIDNLLDPTDRQNVPVCYTLLKEIWSLRRPIGTDKPSFATARDALRILGTLFQHLVLPFVQVTLSLHEQLKHLSAAAHLATFLFTFQNARSKTLPSLTYKDIILMVKNAYFCVAKAKIHNPNSSFWLILLGTDRLESTFGVVRSMVGNDTNADMSSLTTRLSHAVECLNVFSLHPEWDRGPRWLKLRAIEDSNGDVLSSVDHISPKTWKGDVSLESFVLLTAWNEGRQLIETEFASLGVSSHFAEMEKTGVDLLYPFGRFEDAEDEEDENEAVNTAPTETPSFRHVDLNTVTAALEEDAAEPLSLEDHIDIEENRDSRGKYNPFIDAGNGKMVSKARVLRELERATFSRIPGSTDRMTRIAGGGRFSKSSTTPNVIESSSIFGSSTLCVGDPAATIVNCEGRLFLAIIHVSDIIVDFNATVEIDIKLLMEPVVVIQFQICQIVETIRPNDTGAEFVIDEVEWRWNRKMETKVR